MIPWLITIRLGLIGLIPVVGCLAGGIEFYDNPTIPVSFVLDDLTWFIFGSVCWRAVAVR
jgi:hypothetical protein